MINIISTCADSTRITGPQKVFANLTKGLDKIDYPYVINRDLNATKRLWIHDDVNALRYMHRSKAYKVVGPNLFVMPSDIPKDIRFNGALYLHPSDWAVEVWQHAGFNLCPLAAWPVGIDTGKFTPSTNSCARNKILVYQKRRDPKELQFILNTLRHMKMSYSTITYGNYNEWEYQDLLSQASFIIWHGCHESQGIALQEAMSCNIPILVCDVTSLAQEVGGNFDQRFFHIPVTSAPYFDDRCGTKITDLSGLKEAIEFMLDKLAHFAPRQYILETLPLESQAEAFVRIWEKWELTFAAGKSESVKCAKSWKLPLNERWLRAKNRLIAKFINRVHTIRMKSD